MRGEKIVFCDGVKDVFCEGATEKGSVFCDEAEVSPCCVEASDQESDASSSFCFFAWNVLSSLPQPSA